MHQRRVSFLLDILGVRMPAALLAVMLGLLLLPDPADRAHADTSITEISIDDMLAAEEAEAAGMLPEQPAAAPEHTEAAPQHTEVFPERPLTTPGNDGSEVEAPAVTPGNDGSEPETPAVTPEDAEEKAEVQLVQNNGGEVAGYLGDFFFWRYSAQSRESVGSMNYYPFAEGVRNDFVRQDSSGHETVLFQDAGYGNVYIAHDRVFVMTENGIHSTLTDGSGFLRIENANPVTVDSQSGDLLYEVQSKTGSGELYHLTADLNSNRVLHATADYKRTYIGTQNGNLYYHVFSDGVIVIRKVGVQSGDDRILATLPVAQDYYPGQAFLRGREIFMAVSGSIVGTGLFYTPGDLYSISLEDGTVKALIRSSDYVKSDGFVYDLLPHEDPLMYSDIYFVANNDAGDGKIVYYLTDRKHGESNLSEPSLNDANFYPYYLNQSVRLDTTDMSLSLSAVPMTPDGQYVLENGSVLTRVPGSDYYQTVVTADGLARWNYRNINDFTLPHITNIQRFNLVGDYAFFEIWDIEKNEEKTLGWRQGYELLGSVMWRIHLGTGEMQFVYKFGTTSAIASDDQPAPDAGQPLSEVSTTREEEQTALTVTSRDPERRPVLDPMVGTEDFTPPKSFVPVGNE